MNQEGKLGVIIALSIAMVGATIVVTYGAQQVEAKEKEYCFGTSDEHGDTLICGFAKKSECVDAAEALPDSTLITKKCFEAPN